MTTHLEGLKSRHPLGQGWPEMFKDGVVDFQVVSVKILNTQVVETQSQSQEVNA